MLLLKSKFASAITTAQFVCKIKTIVLCILGVTWTQKMPDYLHLYKPLESISK